MTVEQYAVRECVGADECRVAKQVGGSSNAQHGKDMGSLQPCSGFRVSATLY